MRPINKILVIDSSHLMRLQVKKILEQANFEVLELADVNDLFIGSWRFKDVGLILLSFDSSGMDGLSVLKMMNSNTFITWPPVIVLSKIPDKETIKAALRLKAKAYILRPFNTNDLLQKIGDLLAPPPHLRFRQHYLELIQLLKETHEIYLAGDCKQFPREKLNVLFAECLRIVQSDEKMILFHDEFHTSEYEYSHSINVAILSGTIATWMDLKEQEIQELVFAGLLHDLGKIRIAREILLKTDKPTASEMKILKTHSSGSYELIKDAGFSQNVLLGVSQHHERMDGSGYPDKLMGQDISLAARIVAVADVYDAMTSNKVYRQAETPFAVIEELFKEMFAKLDPHICSVFLKNLKERLVGQHVRLSDGSGAEVKRIDGDGFGNPVLEDIEGRHISLSNDLNVVEIIGK